jgi:ribosomal protein L11 methyltransferase
MNRTFQYLFTVNNEEQADILTAELANAGFDGFENKPGELLAFINEETIEAESLEEIFSRYQVQPVVTILENKNWNQVWESSFEPVQVGNFCLLRAGFHPPATDSVQYEIIITPKMSFGTGHHATTYMMMEAMRDRGCAGRKVYDFGTGTGVLAILAEKMGAETVEAIDNDDWSIENALENLEVNHCKKVAIRKADSFDGEKNDIVLANINLHILLMNMKAFKKGIRNGGSLIVSGILETDETIMIEMLAQNGFSIRNIRRRQGWLCIESVLSEPG